MSQQKGEGNIFVSEPNYHTTKLFIEHLLAIEKKKTEIPMNKPVYLGLSILELSFSMIMQNQNMVIKRNFAIWIQTVSLYT